MATNGTAVDALLKLAAARDVIDLDAAAMAVHGRPASQAERNRLACIAWKLIRKGEFVKAGRGRYKSATPKLPPIDELGVVTPRPVGPTAVVYQINRMAHLLAEFSALSGEVLSDLHRANGSRGTVPSEDDRPTSFPLRMYASTSSTVTVRRREP